jgi:hypothetical protein
VLSSSSPSSSSFCPKAESTRRRFVAVGLYSYILCQIKKRGLASLHGQTDGQTYVSTDGQTDRQTDRHFFEISLRVCWLLFTFYVRTYVWLPRVCVATISRGRVLCPYCWDQTYKLSYDYISPLPIYKEIDMFFKSLLWA